MAGAGMPPAEGMPLIRTSNTRDWVIKVSKLCNLRCHYCYEWNELGDPARMNLDLWRRILEAVRRVGQASEDGRSLPEVQNIIWHGGEPMLLPLEYFRQVMELQHSMFPAEWFATGKICNSMQTNLFALDERKIAFFRQNGIGFGVSFDVISGARFDGAGRPSEERVRSNLRRLKDLGIEPSLIVVVAGHTAPMIDAVYEFMAQQGSGGRLLPLFKGPPERPMAGLSAEPDAINAALMRFFRRWFDDGCPFQVKPFDQYLTIVAMKMLGLENAKFYDRRELGDRIIVVNQDGRLYEPCTGYGDEFALGDLRSQSIEDVLASPDYRRSLDRNDALRGRICGGCEYLGSCGSGQLFMNNHESAERNRCIVAQPLLRQMEQHLRQCGVDEAALSAMVPADLSIALH